MLNQLLETKQAMRRTPIGTVVSVVLHVCAISAATELTQRATTALAGPVSVVVRVPTPPADPAPTQTGGAHHTGGAPAPEGMTPLPPIAEDLIEIPPLDLGVVPTPSSEWGTAGVPGGTTHVAGDAHGDAIGGDGYFDFQVDKVAEAVPGTSAPSYPESLRSAGVDGEALVQFVVDTLGRAELGSFKVLRATHDAFGESVRAALPRMRFLPAELGGRKVRMLVQQPFTFALQRP